MHRAPQRASYFVTRHPRQAIYGNTEGYVLPRNDGTAIKFEKNWKKLPRAPYTEPSSGEEYDIERHVSSKFVGYISNNCACFINIPRVAAISGYDTTICAKSNLGSSVQLYVITQDHFQSILSWDR